MYQPEAVITIIDDGTRIPALRFNLPVPVSAGASNPAYAAKLIELGRRLARFPPTISMG